MDEAGVLIDAYGRIRSVVHSVLDGLDPDDLTFRVADSGNTIAWLVWHLARVQDDHVAEVAGTEQVWTSGGWAGRFGLPFDDAATGYGHGEQDVIAVRAPGQLLVGYFDAVHEASVTYLHTLGADDLDRVVDENWTPAVTLGVRLISVLSDDLQHAGQAAFIKGMLPS